MRTFVYYLQREIVLTNYPPKRIVSLVPSQTELLSDLGLDTEVIGITKFCVHPKEWKKQKVIVGGTKQVHYDKVKQLNPDLIIANKEENTQEIVQNCSEIAPVYVTEVENIHEAFRAIQDIGDLVNKKTQAEQLCAKIQQDFEQHKEIFSGSILYFIWREPYMAAGTGTFINALLSHFGWNNLACSLESRYPTLTELQIQELNPEYIFLPSEPYPFKEKHVQELQLIVPNTKILLVDGEMFSWYGSHMQYTCAYVTNLFSQLSN